MIAIIRPAKRVLVLLALAAVGCGETGDTTTDSGQPAPVSAPSAPAPAAPADASPAKREMTITAAPEKVAPAASLAPADTSPAKPAEPTAAAATQKAAADTAGVKLEKVKFDEFARRMVNKDAKFTVVDVWATWCGPCKENFHHAVEMHHKYKDKGLAVASLSFDDPQEAKQVHDAQEFLAEKKAVMANYLLDEAEGVGNEKLNINAIPAVFIFGSDGKEVKRFTMDDPNKQFTYDEVEKTVVALLEGKPLPKDESPKASEK